MNWISETRINRLTEARLVLQGGGSFSKVAGLRLRD